MGVLAGKFYGKNQQGIFELKRKRLVEAVVGMISSAEMYGLNLADREVFFWKAASGNKSTQ